MAIDENVQVRLLELIEIGRSISQGNEYGQVQNQEHASECIGWIAAAHNVVQIICPIATNPYLKSTESIVERSKTRGFTVNECVGELTAVLKNLLSDSERGLLASITNQAQAEAFDDLLEHAKSYLEHDHKEGAGVLASAVFEDTVRRIARMSKTIDADKKLDTVISALASEGRLSSIKAKRCRAAADLRNKALHGSWEDYELSDVKSSIELTRELLEEHLAG